MADISFNIACKELKIAQIAQLNQLFQLLHLVHIYGHGFYELSRMLMRKNVDNDVCIDSPIFGLVFFVLMSLRENGIVKNFPIALSVKARSHVRILTYRTWAIERFYSNK